MRLIITTFLLTLGATVCAQNIRFSDNDDLRKVYQDDIVEINTDTAFIISKTRAGFLNQRLDELDSVKILYNNLANNHNGLVKEIKNIQKLLTKLSVKLEREGVDLNRNLSAIVDELDSSLDELKKNNKELRRNNSDLLSQINQLKRIVKGLKKETRGIWWNGVTDKVIVFVGGVGVGILIAGLL